MSVTTLAKIDLSAIKAIAHDGAGLQVLIEQAGNYRIESLPAPEQAFQGLLQLARFADLTHVKFGNSAALIPKTLTTFYHLPNITLCQVEY